MKKEKLLLFILALVQFANIIDFMIMMPLAPQLMRVFAITPANFSFLVASYAISAGISGFISAFFVDKIDRKTVLLVVFIGFTVGTLACALAPTFALLMAARILTGIFGGMLGSTVLSIIGDTIPTERRGTAMGIVMAAFSVASVVGVPLGLFLANTYSWHAPFMFLVIISIFIIVLIILYVPSMRIHIAAKDKNVSPYAILKQVTNDPNQLRALAFMFFLMLGQFTVIVFLSKYMVANVGFTENQLTYIYLIGGIASLATAPISGKLSDKYGKIKVFTVFCIITIVPIYIITHLSVVPVALALCFNTLFFIGLTGRSIPASTLATTVVQPKNRGGFMSINACVQQLGSGISSFLAGIIVTTSATGQLQNYELVGYIAIVSSLISLYLAQKIKSIS